MPNQTPGRDHTAEPAPAPALLTIAEAAELLRAPVATLRYWRHLGAGPRSFRLGRRVVYRRDDLHAWIDARRDEAGPVFGAKSKPPALLPRAHPREAERASARARTANRRAAGRRE